MAIQCTGAMEPMQKFFMLCYKVIVFRNTVKNKEN